jgi:hypothetical protein
MRLKKEDYAMLGKGSFKVLSKVMRSQGKSFS